MRLLPVLLSLCLVAGVLLVASASPRFRRPHLAPRLEPYLRGLRPWRSRLLDRQDNPLTPFPTVNRLLRPILQEGARLVDRWAGGSASVARRLHQAGKQDTVARFRAEQVLWSLVGFLAAVMLTVALPALLGRPAAALAALGAVSLGLLGGLLGRDWWLTREVQRRQAKVLAEFPTIADLICLAVTAGESPRVAIERTVRRTHGQMSRELGIVLADMSVGATFAVAMERLAARVPIPQVARFVDGLVVATERGTPLADVLRAQAADVREQRKRELIEAGGRREVYMLIPVVFLILPVVVLFALYPGFVSLSQIAR